MHTHTHKPLPAASLKYVLLPPSPPLSTPRLPAQIDRFLYSTDNQVVAGALLAVGIVNSGVQDEVDPALALLSGE